MSELQRANDILATRGAIDTAEKTEQGGDAGVAEGQATSTTFVTHLKNIALAIGTYQATMPYLKHDASIRVLHEINGGLGARVVLAPLARMSMMWTWDPFQRMSRSMRLLRQDYGDDGFEFDDHVDTIDGKEVRRVLRITRCLYRDVLDEEMGRPGTTNLSTGVLDACCCSVDRLWFDAMAEGAKSKVSFTLDKELLPVEGGDGGRRSNGDSSSGGGGGGAHGDRRQHCCAFVLERNNVTKT